jgi:nucleoside-diphosphate-sugar epimerase
MEEALSRGSSVTVLNRGNHEPPAGVEQLRGDRTMADGLAALGSGEWDLVVDTWSWAPSAVRDAAHALAGRAERYAYVSSRSVYEFPLPAGSAEDHPVADGSADDEDHKSYPRTKVGGELGAVESFGDNALLLRAGLILGPYENIGRLPWWLNRIAQGGPVLAPGPADAGIQFIDVRDLAAFTLDVAGGGIYDVVSPPGHATMRGLLEACVAVTGSDAELRWTDPEAILAAGIEPWKDLPVWLPPGEGYDAFHQSDVSKAVKAGLRNRPVEETVADTWSWLRTLGGLAPHRADRPPVGLTPEQEAKAWQV